MALSYVESTLAEGEQVLGQMKQTKWQYLWPLISCFILIGFIWIPWTLLKRRTTELVYTNNRVITKHGIIGRDTDEIRIDKIESVDVKQGVLQRMFGYGHLLITGTGGKLILVPFVTDIVAIRKALVDLQ